MLSSINITTDEPRSQESIDFFNNAQCTDLGQAQVMQKLFGHLLRYVEVDDKNGYWIVWNGVYWERAGCGIVKQMVVETSVARLRAVQYINDKHEIKEMLNWNRQSQNLGRMESTANTLQFLSGIPIPTNTLNKNPMLLGCENGIIDLTTGTLRPGQQKDMIDKSTLVNFDPSARCDNWLKFLDDIFQGNEALVPFCQRAIGYSLTGLTSEQCAFLCYGKGSNGKSKFLAVIRTLLGDYAVNTQFATLLDARRNPQSASPDLASLAGTRLVTAGETNEGKRLDEGRIKSMTGGDPLTARHLYGQLFTFMPEFKLWLAFNHKPVIRGTDEAIWRRIKLIPFLAYFDPDDPQTDKEIEKKLLVELPGILTWAIRGCLDWQENGLGEPEAVKAATQVYRQESDTLAQFLADCTTTGGNCTVRAADFYAAYKKWSEDNGEKFTTGTDFGRRITERGFDKYHDRNGWIYVGIGLLAPVSERDEKV